jgi:hypothetical protein
MVAAMANNPEIVAHEGAFLTAFIRKNRRDRLAFEFQKHRDQFLARFSHSALANLDPRFVIRIDPPNSDASGILRLLMSKGAVTQCYAMSMNAAIDGRMLPLAEALAAAVGFGLPTILSCQPGTLAYIETEQEKGPPDRFMVIRSLKKER